MPSENMHNGQKRHKESRTLFARLITPLILFIVLLVVVGTIVIRRTGVDEEHRPREAMRISVETAPVIAMTLRDTVTGMGTLEPMQTVEIKPEVGGKLLSVNFREGEFVDEGQVLFEIDDEKISRQLEARRAALDSTRARLENLRRNYERVATLRERDLISEDQYDNARTELNAVSADVERLEAEMEIAKRELEDTVIHSPFNGYISRQMVDPGTVVQAGQSLAVIYEVDPLQLSFFIAERYMGRVSRGQDVFATVTAYPDRSFTGEVDFISPVIDAGTRRFRVRANIENPETELMPGSFASALLVLENLENRLVIPEQALVPTRLGYIVYVVNTDNDTAARRQVETGLRQPGLVEITDGLAANERVVAYGHMQLDDGSPVNIVESWNEDWAGEIDTNQRGSLRIGTAALFLDAAMVRGG